MLITVSIWVLCLCFRQSCSIWFTSASFFLLSDRTQRTPRPFWMRRADFASIILYVFSVCGDTWMFCTAKYIVWTYLYCLFKNWAYFERDFLFLTSIGVLARQKWNFKDGDCIFLRLYEFCLVHFLYTLIFLMIGNIFCILIYLNLLCESWTALESRILVFWAVAPLFWGWMNFISCSQFHERRGFITYLKFVCRATSILVPGFFYWY